MIVFDASTLVSAALKTDGVPERTLLRAEEIDVLALSAAVDNELSEVLSRPKFAHAVSPARRERFLEFLSDLLVLHPWRGVRILSPVDYLALT